MSRNATNCRSLLERRRAENHDAINPPLNWTPLLQLGSKIFLNLKFPFQKPYATTTRAKLPKLMCPQRVWIDYQLQLFPGFHPMRCLLTYSKWAKNKSQLCLEYQQHFKIRIYRFVYYYSTTNCSILKSVVSYKVPLACFFHSKLGNFLRGIHSFILFTQRIFVCVFWQFCSVF